MKPLSLTENAIALILVLALMLSVYHFYGKELSSLVTGQFEKVRVEASR